MANIKNLKQLNEFLGEAGSNFVLIDFFANWCGPCKEIGPKVDQLAQQLGNLTIVKVNVDESDEIVEAFEVNVLPTFVIVKSRKKLETFTGSDFDKLKEMVLTVTRRKSTAAGGQAVPGQLVSTQPMDKPLSKPTVVGRLAHGAEALPPGQQHSSTRLHSQHSATKINRQVSSTKLKQQHSATKLNKQNSASKVLTPKADKPTASVAPPKVQTPVPGGQANKKKS